MYVMAILFIDNVAVHKQCWKVFVLLNDDMFAFKRHQSRSYRMNANRSSINTHIFTFSHTIYVKCKFLYSCLIV